MYKKIVIRHEVRESDYLKARQYFSNIEINHILREYGEEGLHETVGRIGEVIYLKNEGFSRGDIKRNS